MPVIKSVAPINLVTLVGVLHRPPQLRVLKDGRSVTMLDVKVAPDDGAAEIVRVSWFDAPTTVFDLHDEEAVAVVGRVRRFWYAGRQSITDVVADRVVPLRSAARVRRVLGDAMAALQEASP